MSPELLLQLATTAVRNGASDLYLAEGALARFKIGGRLEESTTRPHFPSGSGGLLADLRWGAWAGY